MSSDECNVCVPNRAVVYTQLTFGCRDRDRDRGEGTILVDRKTQHTYQRIAHAPIPKPSSRVQRAEFNAAVNRRLVFVMLWWVCQPTVEPLNKSRSDLNISILISMDVSIDCLNLLHSLESQIVAIGWQIEEVPKLMIDRFLRIQNFVAIEKILILILLVFAVWIDAHEVKRWKSVCWIFPKELIR